MCSRTVQQTPAGKPAGRAAGRPGAAPAPLVPPLHTPSQTPPAAETDDAWHAPFSLQLRVTTATQGPHLGGICTARAASSFSVLSCSPKPADRAAFPRLGSVLDDLHNLDEVGVVHRSHDIHFTPVQSGRGWAVEVSAIASLGHAGAANMPGMLRSAAALPNQLLPGQAASNQLARTSACPARRPAPRPASAVAPAAA